MVAIFLVPEFLIDNAIYDLWRELPDVPVVVTDQSLADIRQQPEPDLRCSVPGVYPKPPEFGGGQGGPQVRNNRVVQLDLASSTVGTYGFLLLFGKQL